MPSKFVVLGVAALVSLGIAAAPAAPVVAAPEAAPCRTIPVDADPVLNSDLARADFGVDGTGVKVGIISNSYNLVATLSTADENIADGLLPGAGNPCGYTHDVRVLSDYPLPIPADASAPTDEGRAMAQMVHGIAPGAELFFASAGAYLQNTEEAIDLLAQSGVDIILDDVIPDNEPFYQRSTTSSRIDQLVAEGITYLSAAGNNTVPAITPRAGQERTPVGAWETSAYRPAPECDPTIAIGPLPDGYTGFDCLDFDPGEGVSTISNILVLPMDLPLESDGVTAQLPLIMQWGEPFGKAEGRFEMIVTTNTGTPTTLGVAQPGDPIREAEIPFDVTGKLDPTDLVADEVNMQISIIRFTDGSEESTIEPPIGFLSSADGALWAVNADWWQSQGPDTVGRSIVGHNGAPSAITVAATGAFGDDRVEYYSSIGPVTYYVGPQTDPDAAKLPEPEVHHKPNILSVDGARQNVITGAAPPTPEAGVFLFDGTSAATPTAGGVVALALQLYPSLTPAEVHRLLAETATPIAAPWATVPAQDSVGAGLINAQAFLYEVEAAIPVPAADGSAPGRPALAASGSGDVTALLLAGGVMMLVGTAVFTIRRRGVRSRG